MRRAIARGAARVRRGTVAAARRARTRRARSCASPTRWSAARRRCAQLLVAEAGATGRHARHAGRLARSSISGTGPSWRAPSTFEEPLPARAPAGPARTADELGDGLPPAGRRLRHDPHLELPGLRQPCRSSARRSPTGCTMVFKPSPWGPLINLFLAELIAEADLPPGVVNFVTGQSTPPSPRRW